VAATKEPTDEVSGLARSPLLRRLRRFKEAPQSIVPSPILHGEGFLKSSPIYRIYFAGRLWFLQFRLFSLYFHPCTGIYMN